MNEPDQYSEKIVFSSYGVRMAIIDDKGKIAHRDNWQPELFGGFLPAIGDYLTTLWDPLKPEPAEHYLVVARYYIGELKGDNCWWLLLREAKPSDQDRMMFQLAREQSSQNKSFTGNYETLVEIRGQLDKKKPLVKRRLKKLISKP